MTEKVLTTRFGLENSHTLKVYEQTGGYKTARKCLDMSPEEIIDEVKKANLRGRGGAGFPAGVKWGFVPKDTSKDHFLVINADEGEPGTFKDRYLMQLDPHQLLEGMIIACRAIRAEYAYIYVRGEMWLEKDRLDQAIAEAEQAGYLGGNLFGTGNKLKIRVATGAGAYVCGEETALLNSLEGKRGEPRLKPPFPAVVGAFGQPTIINNVETISNVPHIMEKGGEWFHALGVQGDGGTRIIGISGMVKRPGIYEMPVGFNMKSFIEQQAGGLRDGLTMKALIPGGSSCPILKPEEIDIPFSNDSLKSVGSMAGSGAMIVIGNKTCMVRAMENLAHFYAHESCGQCTPCREGTHFLHLIIKRLEAGKGTMEDIDSLYRLASNMEGATICPLAEAAAWPMKSFITKFRDEFEAHVTLGRCPMNHAIA